MAAWSYFAHPGFIAGDLSQTIGRSMPQRTADQAMAILLPNSRFYFRSLERWLTGKEILAMQGFPAEALALETLQKADIHDSLLRDLAGNSWSAGSYLALMIFVLTCILGELLSMKKKESDPVDPTTLAAELMSMCFLSREQRTFCSFCFLDSNIPNSDPLHEKTNTAWLKCVVISLV